MSSDIDERGRTILPSWATGDWEAVDDGDSGYRRIVCGVELRLWNVTVNHSDTHNHPAHCIARDDGSGSPLSPLTGWGGMFDTVRQALELAQRLEQIIKWQERQGRPVA